MKRTKEFRREQQFKHRGKTKKVLEQLQDRVDPCDAGKAEAVHNCFCSGPCCGNPRKWFGEDSVQERRAEDILGCGCSKEELQQICKEMSEATEDDIVAITETDWWKERHRKDDEKSHPDQ